MSRRVVRKAEANNYANLPSADAIPVHGFVGSENPILSANAVPLFAGVETLASDGVSESVSE